MKKLSSLIIIICIFFANYTYGQITPGANNILYINTNVSGGNGTGDSWTNAIKELADALKWAGQNKTNNLWSSTNPLQLWIADGTYKPKYSPIDGDNYKDNPTNPRDRTFLMVKDVKLYGGFLGNETDINQRSFANGNKTILSGDFSGNDIISGYGKTLTISQNTENAYHVLLIAANFNTTVTANIDGIFITGANKSDVDYTNSYNDSYILVNTARVPRTMGGGILNNTYINLSDINLTNSTIAGNYTGIYSDVGSQLNITNSNISRNYQTGISFSHPSPTTININNSSINDNYNTGISAGANSGLEINIKNSSICGNHSVSGASVISTSCYYGSVVKLTNCTITANTGSLIIYGNSIKGNCWVYGNNSIIYGNEGYIYASVLNSSSPKTKIYKNSLIQGENSTADGNLNGTLFHPILFKNFDYKDYTLANGSVAADKGNNAIYTSNGGNLLMDKDLTGNPRVHNYTTGGVIDLGAYESDYVDLAVTDSDKNKINLYPNSTTGIFYIETQSSGKSELFNINGQLIKTVDLKLGQNRIDISALPSGVYILKFDSKSFKIIKK